MTTCRLSDYGDEASSIDITLSGGVDADAAARSVSAALGDDYRVLTRLQQHEGSFRMISIEKYISPAEQCACSPDYYIGQAED